VPEAKNHERERDGATCSRSVSKNVVNQETRLSRKVAKPLKIAKTKPGWGAAAVASQV
jgi:hypothetical protein